jgi:hypothetical protein
LIAAAVAGLLALTFALFMLKNAGRRPTSKGKQNQPATAAAAAAHSRSGASTATRNVAGAVFFDDNAAAGATVRIVERRGLFQASRQTDGKGHFDFGPVPVANYRLIAEVPHGTGTAIGVDLADRTLDAEKLRLIVHACDASLAGVVRDVSGGGVGGAHLFVSAAYTLYDGFDGADEGPGINAADDGTYELCVPVGDSVVIVRADGYADALARVSTFGRVRRDFELAPEAVVSGRVVRASDGVPVAAARLQLQSDPQWDRYPSRDLEPILAAVSDSDGQFRFRGVARGQYSLSATADHLASERPRGVNADVAMPVEGIEVKLVRTFSIAGHVVEKQSKKPVHGRVVWAFGPQKNDRTTISASDGSFVFENLAHGEYRIAALPILNANAGLELKLDKADVDGLQIDVDPWASIAGRVTRAGKPIDGATVQVYDVPSQGGAFTSAATDGDGRFIVRELPARSYRLYAESKRVGAFTPGPVVTVANGDHRTGVEVEMSLAGSIAGTVVDQAGAPVAGAHLRFSLINGEDFGETTTADDGTFKAAALSGGGDYIFEVRGTSDSKLKLRPANATRFTPITVRDGDSHVTGVQIKVQFDRLTIRGRVVASDGSGVPDVPVITDRKKGGDAIGPTATTDANGAFTISNLPAGRYNVYTRSTAGFARAEAVAAGSKNVELRLPALAAIDGTLDGFATPPSVAAFSTSRDTLYLRYRATVTGRAFSIKNVPVGTYVVLAQSDEGYARATVVVERKAASQVTLRNVGFGTIEGRVVDETTRKPLAGIECADNSSETRTDSSGAFRFERVPAGSDEVGCFGADIEARAVAMVARGKTTHVEVAAKKITRPAPVRGYVGLELELQAGNVAVKKVVPGGPAERAGIKSGDIVREVDQEDVDIMQGPQWVLYAIEDRPTIGSTVKVTLERDSTERTVEIKVEPRP